MRLPWQRKALYLLAHSLVVAVTIFGPSFASRFGLASDGRLGS